MKKLSLIVAILLCATFAFTLCACSSKSEGKSDNGFLTCDGKDFVNDDGVIQLVGTNAGGWLVAEGWMGMTKMNSDASVEVSQSLVISTLTERFGKEKADALLDVYYDNWWTEEDFDNIVELGFNCIRLPFCWYNLLDNEYNLIEGAFDRIDWFVDNCLQRGLYVILDCHGAVGSQNGQHHSGDYSQAELFNNESFMAATEKMWVMIAERYADNKAVAGYDLLNEPQGGLREGKTTEKQWNYYDRLYDAIRQVDTNHIIFMESCWEQKDLPNPKSYGWTNVAYEYHYYNWTKPNSELVNWLFVNSKVVMGAFSHYDVPVLIGEFTFFDNANCWNYGLKTFDNNGWSWTTWTYKVNSAGNWGLYFANLEKVDISTASIEEIARVWASSKTVNFGKSDTYNTISAYLSGK